ncbi:unknown [Bacteroides sp. CAG:462]|nr:unknown [Bacteroides sp. CAG:462]
MIAGAWESSSRQTIPLSHTASFIKKQASRLICLTDSRQNILYANAYF